MEETNLKEKETEEKMKNTDGNNKEIKVKESNKKKKIIILAVIISIILVAILALSTVFAIMNINNDKIVSGVKIKGIDVSGLTEDEAKSKIELIYQEKNSRDIELKYEDYEASINSELLEINYEIENVYNLIILLEQELERIAIDYNIKAGDIKFENMIYNENQNLINIIDTDHFTVSNKDKYKIAKYNLNRLKLSLSTQLSRTGCLSNIKDKETRNILGNLIANDDLKFSDLIYSIKEKENVRTLNGLKRK